MLTFPRLGIFLGLCTAVVVSGCSTKAASSAATGSTSGEAVIKTARGVDGSTINLGVLTDLTGVFSAAATDITNAHALYWQKAGKICSGRYTVSLNIRDTAYSAQQAVQQYSAIKGDVVAMQQTVGSPSNAALSDQYQSDHVVNLPTGWARSLTDNPSNIVPGATYDVEMVNGLSYALDKGLIRPGDKVGHIYLEGEVGGNALAGSKHMAAKHDLTIVEVQVKPTDADMSSQVTRLKAEGVSAIALSVSPGQTASTASVAASQGLNVPLIGNSPVFAAGLLQGPAATALKEHLIIASPYSTLDKHPDLLASYRAKYPSGTPTSSVVLGYGMADIMRQILEKGCANGDLSPEGLVQAKSQLTTADTGGLIVPLNLADVGRSPSSKSFILQPVDVVGGLSTLTDATESPDVAGLS